MPLRELWTWSGEIGRGRFAAWGCALLAIKVLGDLLLTHAVFARTWTPTIYWFPGRGLVEASEKDRRWLIALLAWSLPFLAAGLALTTQRLRSLRLPLLLAVLFAVPIVNLAFFAILLLTPARAAPPLPMRPEMRPTPTQRARGLPRNAFAGAAVITLLSVTLSGLFVWLSVVVLQDYGYALFVLTPLTLGVVTASLWNWHSRGRLRATLAITAIECAVCALAVLLLGIEGAVCILMTLPIAVPIAMLGALIGWLLTGDPPSARARAGRALPGLVLFVPIAMTLEHAAPPPPPSVAVASAIEIDAPPERVWPHVVAFGAIQAPREALFRFGIACPLRATIDGRGLGALRQCTFTTGSFLEPIEVWDEPHRLRFSIVENPPTMHEWSPWGDLAAAHLQGSFVATAGEFRLVGLPGERTRLEGTTWYRQSLWPSLYWRLWSDAIVHAIHMRVLRHVKLLAETG